MPNLTKPGFLCFLCVAITLGPLQGLVLGPPDVSELTVLMAGPEYTLALDVVFEDIDYFYEEQLDWLTEAIVSLAQGRGHRRVAGFGLMYFALQHEVGAVLSGARGAPEEGVSPSLGSRLLSGFPGLVEGGLEADDAEVVSNAILAAAWIDPEFQLPSAILREVARHALSGTNTVASSARMILSRNGTVDGFQGLEGALNRPGQKSAALVAMVEWIRYADDDSKTSVRMRESWAHDLMTANSEPNSVARAVSFLEVCGCKGDSSRLPLELVANRQDLPQETRIAAGALAASLASGRP